MAYQVQLYRGEFEAIQTYSFDICSGLNVKLAV